MKRILLLLSLIALVNFTWAQDGDAATTEATQERVTKNADPVPHTYVSDNAYIDKYHNEVELEKLGKLELTKLYLERVAVLTEIIPYLALNKAPAGSGLDELGIPETKTNMSHLDREVRNKDAYLNAVQETMNDIIPYADKKNIVWCILFLEDTLHRIQRTAEAEN